MRLGSYERKYRGMSWISRLCHMRSMLLVASIICCAGFVAQMHNVLGSRAAPAKFIREARISTTETVSSPAHAEGVQVEPSALVQGIYFRITPLGIEPAELTVPAGRYLIAIDNDTGFNAIEINIDKQGGPRLGSAQLPSGKRKSREFVVLTPGRFVLTDASDASRVCYITVTDQ